MNAKTKEFGHFIDEAAKAAHETIDRMRTRAFKMEGDFGERANATAGGLATRMESRMAELSEYVEKNPLAAAMIAFGVGFWATRVFDAKGPVVTEAVPVAVGTKRSKKVAEPHMRKAA